MRAMYSTLIRNVSIVDGTGQPGFPGDIGIRDGKIASVGVCEQTAARVVDASGLTAVPGFIDMHSHTDLEYLRDTPPTAKIRQGITTEVLGQDGLGVAPVKDDGLRLLSELTAGLLGILDLDRWTWRSFGDYLVALEGYGLPNNVAALVSHGPLRIMAMGMDNRPATAAELVTMRALIREAMEAGAFGLSTGLIYPPCSFGDADELACLTREVAACDGIFVVHQRDEGYLIRQAFSELLGIARKSGVHLHISHLQAYGQVNWPLMDDILSMADAFLSEGGRLSWDRYPYLAGCTVLSAVLPTWTFEGGTQALIENLKKPEFRARIHADFGKGLEVWNNRSISVGWNKIVVTAVASDKNRWMEGRDCQALADARGQDPVDFVCDLLAEENLAVTMISFYGSEHVMDKVLRQPQATVGTDGIYGGRPHPRLYGTYPRFIQSYVFEKRAFSLAEAVRKVTGFPAQILGLRDRGTLQQGCWADLVLLDLSSLADRATYEQPQQYPLGVEYVFVNGEPVVERGQFTGYLPGRVLRRSQHGEGR